MTAVQAKRVRGWLVLSLGAVVLAGCASGRSPISQSATPPPRQANATSEMELSGRPAAPATYQSDPWPLLPSLSVLVQRLERADEGMQAIRDATELEDAKSAARWVLDLLVGPEGRHAAEFTQSPGVLPADGPEMTDPGLALAAYDGTNEPGVREPIAGLVLGDVDRWRRPTERWNEIDAAVAAWTHTNNPIAALDGHLMRVVGWAVLSWQAPSLERAHEYASHGVIHAGLSLQAAREALAVARSLPQQPEAP